MVKIISFIFCFVTLIQASIVQDKVESFIGKNEYEVQKNLILILFKSENLFLKHDGTVDDLKVLKQLKSSGLLKLFYKSPQDLVLSFYTKENPVIFMRVINEVLSSMGYNYFLTKSVIRNNSGFSWEINLSTEHLVDPIYFADNLTSSGCYIDKIDKKSSNEWFYSINTENIEIDTSSLEPDTTVELKKPIKPYWINVEGTKSISFRSHTADKWHPSIVFFDKQLQIVKDYRNDSVANTLKIIIPESAKYVKINDIYTLDNIKRGLSVYLKSKD